MTTYTSNTNTENGYKPKTLLSYVIGISLSALLTIIAFGLVYYRLISGVSLYFILGGLAIFQLIVQSVYFIRLNIQPEGRWNSFPFLFTLLIISILVSGTLWIMYNLNYNMP